MSVEQTNINKKINEMPYEINKVGNMILKQTKQSVPVITKRKKYCST